MFGLSPIVVKLVAVLAVISAVLFGVHEIRAAGERQAAAEAQAKEMATAAKAKAIEAERWEQYAQEQQAEAARQADLAAQREAERNAAEQRAQSILDQYQSEVSHVPATSCLHQRVPAAVDRLLSAAGQAGHADRGSAQNRQAVPAQ